MKLSTLGELWERLHQFPVKIVYFDKTHNIEDSIYWDEEYPAESRKEMQGFFDDYGDYNLIDFHLEIAFKGYALYVEMEEQEE